MFFTLPVAGITQVTAGCAMTYLSSTCAQLVASKSAAQAGSGRCFSRAKILPSSNARLTITAIPRSAASGRAVVFAIRDATTGRAVGSTRYFDIQPANRALEIGYTWLTPRVWRSAVNTECKYLLLRHAFDRLGCVRVQLKTNAKNARSRAAITRIGATMEGTLRRSALEADGVSFRDTVFFSILDDEWPARKAMLEDKLRPRA